MASTAYVRVSTPPDAIQISHGMESFQTLRLQVPNSASQSSDLPWDRDPNSDRGCDGTCDSPRSFASSCDCSCDWVYDCDNDSGLGWEIMLERLSGGGAEETEEATTAHWADLRNTVLGSRAGTPRASPGRQSLLARTQTSAATDSRAGAAAPSKGSSYYTPGPVSAPMRLVRTPEEEFASCDSAPPAVHISPQALQKRESVLESRMGSPRRSLHTEPERVAVSKSGLSS